MNFRDFLKFFLKIEKLFSKYHRHNHCGENRANSTPEIGKIKSWASRKNEKFRLRHKNPNFFFGKVKKELHKNRVLVTSMPNIFFEVVKEDNLEKYQKRI